MYASLSCRLSLYADDSALFFSHKNADFIADRLSVELCNCQKWLVDNRLSLHLGKTECILFGTKRRLSGVSGFQLSCEGTAVKRVYSVKYLGVKLDANMSGVEHALELLNKCVGRLFFLYRNSSFLDVSCRRILCLALIQPHIDYCCSSWYSGLTAALKGKLDGVQRRMVRFINSFDSRHHVDSRDMKALSWLLVPDRVKYFKLLHVFKIARKQAPRYLLKRFVPISGVHSYETRSRCYDFLVSKELSRSLSSFSYTAVKEWNSLPVSLKQIESELCFRRRLKEYLSFSY